MSSTIILSPHLDDAVFSCWHLLTRPNTTVITVFSGTPSEDTATLWDRICGEPNSTAMMRRRLQENKKVLKDVGVSYRNLNYLDRQYWSAERSIPEIAAVVRSQAGRNTKFFAPLAGSMLRRHPDHVTVREVGKFLLSQGGDVSFYADIPYMQMPAHLTVRYTRRMSRRASKLLGTKVSTEVTELTARDQAHKRTAMRRYGSQYTMTNLTSLGTLGRKSNACREVTFHISK